MSLAALSNGANLLGQAKAEFGNNKAKMTLLTTAVAELTTAITDVAIELSAGQEALAAEARNEALLAINCANNNTDGSGGPNGSQKHFTEPFHTKKALEKALAAIAAA